MTQLRTVHAAELDAATARAARSLLVEAFAGDFDDHDWGTPWEASTPWCGMARGSSGTRR